MNQQIKEFCYFIRWLIIDFCKNIDLLQIYIIAQICAIIAIMVTDTNTNKLILIGMLVSMFVMLLVDLVIKPIRNKYREYKQERKNLLTVIKGDD